MAKTCRPAAPAKPLVSYENGCIVIRQQVVCGDQPTVNIFFNNRSLPKSAKYSTEVVPDGLAHLVTFRIKEVTMY